MSIKLKKNCFIVSFLIVLFSLIAISIARAECLVKVQYNDGCPRSNADVFVRYPTPSYIGRTNESGQVDCSLANGDYQIYALYPPGGSQFGSDVFLRVPGSTTITQNSNYPSESCGDSGCSGTTYCLSGVIKCGASCVVDANACWVLGACQCRVSGTYPCVDCCTSSKPTCCLLGSAKTNECNTDADCGYTWCCIQGWQSKCCMPSESCGCGVTTTTTTTSTTITTTTSTTTTTTTTSTTTRTTTSTTTTKPTTTTTTRLSITTTSIGPYTNCKLEGGRCIMGSGGCIAYCERLGKGGYCEIADPKLGYYPGCGIRDCCCFCEGVITRGWRRISLSLTYENLPLLFTGIFLSIIFMVAIFAVFKVAIRSENA